MHTDRNSPLKNTRALFYALVVFLEKWAYIKKNIPIVSKGLT